MSNGWAESQELHEHAQHGAHDHSMAPVSLSMAILAVFVAMITLLGHRTHTEEVVMQTKANDQWAYYQGKDTRLHTDEKLVGLAGFISASDAGYWSDDMLTEDIDISWKLQI